MSHPVNTLCHLTVAPSRRLNSVAFVPPPLSPSSHANHSSWSNNAPLLEYPELENEENEVPSDRYGPVINDDFDLINELLFSQTRATQDGGNDGVRVVEDDSHLVQSAATQDQPPVHFEDDEFFDKATEFYAQPLSMQSPSHLPTPPSSPRRKECSFCKADDHPLLECSLAALDPTPSYTDLVLSGGHLSPEQMRTPEGLSPGAFHTHDTSSPSSVDSSNDERSPSPTLLRSPKTSQTTTQDDPPLFILLPTKNSPEASVYSHSSPGSSPPPSLTTDNGSDDGSDKAESIVHESRECKVTFFHQRDRLALCRVTGLPQDTEFGDPVSWMRVISRFTLTQCEEQCRYWGQREWIIGIHEKGPMNRNVEELEHYFTLFALEPETKLDTNVFLHPIERQSALQCLAFLLQPDRIRGASVEECQARRMLEHLVGTRSEDEVIANLTNFRRLRGDFGGPGEYPTYHTTLSRSNPTQLAVRSTVPRL